MVIRRSHETRLVIWPHYFDRRITRDGGRRVPKKISVEGLKLDRLINAANAADLKFEVQADVSHPFFWWEKSGRILVVSEEPKTKVIKLIAERLRENQHDDEEQ